ncbi:toll-like receptor 6 [Saccostrea cucullata]|uniref:toll-like receptor 6 n=1 Tax=Saccostrea cuccullata TaxID=36930 RepID=UPI002ED29D17
MYESLQIKTANLPRSALCGSEENLRIKIERNHTFSFIHDLGNSKSDIEMFAKIATENIMDSRLSPHKCVYKKLEVLEQSVTSSLSRYYATNLIEQNRFPELSVLNISHSNIYRIPENFKTWWMYFPNLKYLDMSYNRIQDIVFPRTDARMMGNSISNLTLDLTFNNISELSVRDFERIIQNKYLFVKLANNPFNCTCSDKMKEVLRYIQERDWNSSKYQKYSYIRDLECYYPKDVRGRRLRDLHLEDISCGFDFMPVIIALSVLSFVLLIFILIILINYRKIRISCLSRLNVDSNSVIKLKENC